MRREAIRRGRPLQRDKESATASERAAALQWAEMRSRAAATAGDLALYLLAGFAPATRWYTVVSVTVLPSLDFIVLTSVNVLPSADRVPRASNVPRLGISVWRSVASPSLFMWTRSPATASGWKRQPAVARSRPPRFRRSRVAPGSCPQESLASPTGVDQSFATVVQRRNRSRLECP